MNNFPSWGHQHGGTVVEQFEHLFGTDLILSKVGEGGRLHPRIIITMTEPLKTGWEKDRARKWCRAIERQDWKWAAVFAQDLAER